VEGGGEKNLDLDTIFSSPTLCLTPSLRSAVSARCRRSSGICIVPVTSLSSSSSTSGGGRRLAPAGLFPAIEASALLSPRQLAANTARRCATTARAPPPRIFALSHTRPPAALAPPAAANRAAMSMRGFQHKAAKRIELKLDLELFPLVEIQIRRSDRGNDSR